MGKTVMRPRMKRGISIAAAVACSFSLVAVADTVSVNGHSATPVANAVAKGSNAGDVLDNKTSIFDNPSTFASLRMK